MAARGGSARFYHDVSLRGPVPDRLLLRVGIDQGPEPALARRLARLAEEDAASLFARGTSSFAFLQGFGWLDALAHREDGRHVAGALWGPWAREHGRYAPRAWAPPLAAARVEHALRHAPLLLEGRDAPVREQVFGMLIRSVRHLARSARRGELGLHVLARATLGALALPGAADHERALRAPLGAACARLSRGDLPPELGEPEAALALARTLTALSDAYDTRGLTPPPGLGEASGAGRLLIGGLLSGATLAVLPGGVEGDADLLDALRPLARPEGDDLVRSFGAERASAGDAVLHVALRGPAAGAVAFAQGDARLLTAAGAPRLGLRALDSGLARWAEALTGPAAAATLDADGFGDAAVAREEENGETLISLTRRGPGGRHERRLHLDRGGVLRGEDVAPTAGAIFRFPLPPTLEARPSEDQRATLVGRDGRSWRFEASCEVAVEEGRYSGGGEPAPAAQLVLRPEREGVRWALRRV